MNGERRRQKMNQNSDLLQNPPPYSSPTNQDRSTGQEQEVSSRYGRGRSSSHSYGGMKRGRKRELVAGRREAGGREGERKGGEEGGRKRRKEDEGGGGGREQGGEGESEREERLVACFMRQS